MAEPETFALADRALARVVAQIAPDQWDMILPSTFVTRSRPEPPPLRALINLDAIAGRACAAVSAVTNLDAVAHLSFGD